MTVKFRARHVADPDGKVVSICWDFGDGKTANGLKVSHRFTIAGSYIVTMTLTDDEGAQTSKTVTIKVKKRHNDDDDDDRLATN